MRGGAKRGRGRGRGAKLRPPSPVSRTLYSLKSEAEQPALDNAGLYPTQRSDAVARPRRPSAKEETILSANCRLMKLYRRGRPLSSQPLSKEPFPFRYRDRKRSRVAATAAAGEELGKTTSSPIPPIDDTWVIPPDQVFAGLPVLAGGDKDASAPSFLSTSPAMSHRAAGDSEFRDDPLAAAEAPEHSEHEEKGQEDRNELDVHNDYANAEANAEEDDDYGREENFDDDDDDQNASGDDEAVL